MNRIALGLLVFLVTICAAQAQIYKWTDSKGDVHFSDVPHPGAEKIEIPEAQTYAPPTPKSEMVPTPSPKKTASDEQKYSKIEIVQPHNLETFRSSQGYIMVAVQLEPPLQKGDKLQLQFDRSPLGEPQVSPVFQLSGIYRGSHTISVQVLDASGNVLDESDSITVYMQNPRTGMGRHGGGR